VTRDFTAALAGVLFGAGLIISGMTDPGKVRGFLDLFGVWDPSLAFVMIGAIGVHSLLLRGVLRLPRPLHADLFHLPTRAELDRPLIIGAALFGVGWGLAGFCPGPALVSAAAASPAAALFVPAMLVGMWLQHRAHRPPSAVV
jgi:uncharacterized membrane protein YedE/YeeE